MGPSIRIRLDALRAPGAQRLAGALVVSIFGHALLLGWPASLPRVASASPFHERAALAQRPALRIQLRRPDESAAEPAPRPVPPPVSAAVPVTLPAPAEHRIDAQPKVVQEPGVSVPVIGYYPASRLSRMPEARGRFEPESPSGAASGVGGKVTVRLWIGAGGSIDDAKVLASDLPPAYADAALAAFRRLQFDAGEIGGVRVPSWVEIVVEFTDFRDPQTAPEGTR